MAIPERITPDRLGDYLDVMTRAIFQSGLRWSLIEAKWPAFRKVFHDFDPERVAAFTQADIDRLSKDESILRSPKKIAGTVKNAQTLLELEREHGGFVNYLRSFENYDALAADIRRRFEFMGELSVYYFLFRVREPVPDFESWSETIPGDHPRMREMVELAKQQDNGN